MYRYWDGHAWSAVTSANPAAPPPSQGIGQPTSPGSGFGGQAGQGGQQSAYQTYQQLTTKKRSPVGWWIGGVALLVAIIVVLVLVVRNLGGSLANDGSNPGGGGSENPCPTTTQAPSAAPNHPNDGRVHGGPVSYPLLPSPWESPRPDDRVPFGSDVQEQTITIEPSYQPGQNWVASILVAELMAGDGFFTPEQGAQIVAKCVVGDFYGDNPVERQDEVSKAMKIDGHDGWYLKSHLSFDIEGLRAKGETMIIAIVSAGETSGLYYASIPDNAQQYMPDATRSLRELTVDS
jgi:hypothetical protein